MRLRRDKEYAKIAEKNKEFLPTDYLEQHSRNQNENRLFNHKKHKSHKTDFIRHDFLCFL